MAEVKKLDNIIKINNVTKVFDGVTVIDDLTLSIKRGKFDLFNISRRSFVCPSSLADTKIQYPCASPRPTRPRNWCKPAKPNRSAFSTIITVALGTLITKFLLFFYSQEFLQKFSKEVTFGRFAVNPPIGKALIYERQFTTFVAFGALI